MSSFLLIFLVCAAVGGLQGTEYTNFLYLANAKIIDLPYDMGLDYYERELTVNLLLIASDLGKLVSLSLTLLLKAYFDPDLL